MIKFSEGKLLIIEGSIDISWKNDNSFLLYLTIIICILIVFMLNYKNKLI